MELRVNQLLQDIQQTVGCDYLSDLRQTSHTELYERIKVAILEIPDEVYTIDEWTQAITYLTGAYKNASSIAEIKNLF